jgi:hypothetical protein
MEMQTKVLAAAAHLQHSQEHQHKLVVMVVQV